jgi:GDSL-like lipase/acylhydrolase family protein
MLARLGRTVVGLVVAAGIFFAVGEALTRVTGLVDRLNGYARTLFEQGPSAELPYRLRPGVSLTLGGIDVRVNAFGLRGPEVAAAPAPGTVRVLVLGDSVVFGQGVAQEDTFPARLAARLGERWHVPVEALNAGAQGYDTVAEAAFLAGPGFALAPQGVVVGMSLNDYDPAPSYDVTGVLTRHTPTAVAPALAHSEFLLLLRWLRAWWRGELLAQMLQKRGPEPAVPVANDGMAVLDRLVATEHLRFYRDPAPALWTRLHSALVALRDQAAARGMWLVVAIFPEAWQVGVAEPDTTPQARLGALCEELGIRCLDLAPAFQAAGGTLFQDAQHPNARGLALAADVVADALAH